MDNQATFDLILGRDFLVTLGIGISHEKREVQWQGLTIPFCSCNTLEPIKDEVANALAGEKILDAKYQSVNTDKVAQQQSHLTQSQRDDLACLLSKFPRFYYGKLRRYPDC